MQRSTPLTRKTGPASCVRNFDGTVSRCFASSVCSKLPLKAKAHVVRKEGVESIRGGGGGGAPPPRTGCSAGKLPHSVPLCNTNIVIRPTKLEPGPQSDRFPLQRRDFPRWVGCRPQSGGTCSSPCRRWSCTPNCSPLRSSVPSCDVSSPLAGPPLPAPDRRPPGRLRRCRRRGRRRSREGGPSRHRDLHRGRRAARGRPARRRARRRAQGAAHRRPGGQAPRADRQGAAGVRRSGHLLRQDIAPWLGQKAGVWVAGVDRAKPGYVVLVAAKDTEKAQEVLDKSAKQEKKAVKQRSYKDVDYQVDSDGVAAGIVGDFLTVGTEPEFKRTVAAEDGDSLADEKRFKSAIDALDDDRIGSFYVDLKPFIEQAVKSDPKAGAQLEQIRSIFPIDKLEPISGALLADGDRIAFDTTMKGSGVKSL